MQLLGSFLPLVVVTEVYSESVRDLALSLPVLLHIVTAKNTPQALALHAVRAAEIGAQSLKSWAEYDKNRRAKNLADRLRLTDSSEEEKGGDGAALKAENESDEKMEIDTSMIISKKSVQEDERALTMFDQPFAEWYSMVIAQGMFSESYLIAQAAISAAFRLTTARYKKKNY